MSNGNGSGATKTLRKKEASERQMAERRALEALAELGGRAFRDEDIIFQGDKLILPSKMTVPDAVGFLNKKMQEENEMTEFSHSFAYKPWDVAYCTFKGLRKFFGAISHTKGQVQTMFGPQSTPPSMITIPIGPNETMEVPWGGFVIPGLPDVQFYLDQTRNQNGDHVGYIHGQGKKKYHSAVQGVFKIIEEELRTNSLYRGRCFDAQQMPQFLDLSSVDKDKIVYAQEVLAQLDANLWSAIRYRDTVRGMGIPFKRAILLAGDFGVGKTLAINRTGQICEEEEITFILVRPGRDDLTQAMLTARMYQPAVVAFEDVDIIADADEDSKHISQILDLFDGIEAKNTEVMLVLTSNFVERLHKGMLRPGRLDAVIKITPLDAAGVEKLIKIHVGDRLAPDIDWEEVTGHMDGYLPAFVVETAQRAIRHSLSRHEGVVHGDISQDDLVYAAQGLRPQFEMMQDAVTDRKLDTVDDALQKLLTQTAAEMLNVAPEPGSTHMEAVQERTSSWE